jgi:crossover junction endodeoxyribonuclease RuvC
MAIILGIDPGSRKLGFGLIQANHQKLIHLDHGVLEIPLLGMPIRLGFIYKELSFLITKFKPNYFSIEEVFVHKNVSSALKLGQARGAAIVAAANHNLEVFEYSPRLVKQAVVGKGAADKYQVQQMVRILLNLPKIPEPDAADALAIAICMANSNLNNTYTRYSRG